MATVDITVPPPIQVGKDMSENEWQIFDVYNRLLYAKIQELEQRIEALGG